MCNRLIYLNYLVLLFNLLLPISFLLKCISIHLIDEQRTDKLSSSLLVAVSDKPDGLCYFNWNLWACQYFIWFLCRCWLTKWTFYPRSALFCALLWWTAVLLKGKTSVLLKAFFSFLRSLSQNSAAKNLPNLKHRLHSPKMYLHFNWIATAADSQKAQGVYMLCRLGNPALL